VLAYSSISQMGLVTVLFGIALGNPERWSMVLMTLLLFCLHHGLAKGALFLGLGAAHRGLALLLLIVPALALAGAPLTSGAAAKLAFKSTVLTAPAHWWDELFQILTWSSLATSLLLARFLYLAWPPRANTSPAPALWLPCVGLLLAGPALSYWWLTTRIAEGAALFETTALSGALAPLLIAALIATGLIGLRRRLPRLPPWAMPEGDILALFSALGGGLQRLITRLGRRATGLWHRHAQPERSAPAWLAALSTAWPRFNTGLVFMLLLVGLGGLLMIYPA
jgi:NADH:ubiquinone oxidoreductase subunit 5 (subunit L)/multisubunit Na+/H+ antiporter MnhA subunit